MNKLCAWIGWGLMAAIVLGVVNRGSAEPISVGRMIVPIKHGFRLSVEMESVPGNGYQPVYLQFNPTGRTFTRERNLTVEITPADHVQSQLDFTYRCRLQLPQNAASMRSVQYIPYYYPWEQVRVAVFEDDQALKGCVTTFSISSARQQPLEHCSVGVIVSGDIDVLLQQNSDIEKQQRSDYRRLQSSLATRPMLPHVTAGGGMVDATSVLLTAVGDWQPTKSIAQPPLWQQCPDVRSLLTAFSGSIPNDPEIRRLDHATALQTIRQVQAAEVQFRVLDAQQMPERWLAHSQLDVILVAAPMLQQLETQLAAYKALTDWLANGGNLWVYATKQAPCELLDRIDLQPIPARVVPVGKALIRGLELDQPNDRSYWEYNAYNGPIRQSSTYAQAAANSSIRLNSRLEVYDAAKKSEHPFTSELKSAEVANLIRHGRFGIGTVTTIDREDPFPQSYQFWTTVVRNTGSEQMDWTERNGINVPAGNSHFWSLMIASVGQPPVKSFIGLNTLFVLIVGPVCYWYLRRRQRLFLLFFFAPAMAMVITVGLVMYAYFADGVRTRTRVRQITWIDPQADYLTTQSRQTYFAVLDSRKGLSLPDDVAVYPVMRGTIRSGSRYRQNTSSRIQGTITAAEGRTQFRGCFLPPRTQVQMLMTKPTASSDMLKFTMTDQSISVTNRFPFSLRQITLRDKKHNFWKSASIAPGATVSLKRMSVGTTVELGVERLKPALQPNLRSTRDPWGRYTVGAQQTLLERSLDDWLTFLPPERFVAVADQPDLELLGVDNAEITQASHVIMGKLP